LFRVLLLNDDYTPMEFVVHVLERFFDFDHDSAAARMMHVHSHGSMRRLSVRSCRQKGERGGGFRPRESASAALRAAGTRSPTLTSVGVGPSAF
jgi:hypothetical protein